MKRQPLKSFRLKNFKAVKDSGTIKFSPLTVFIGNNGSGKSSVVEGLETLQTIATYNLDKGMNQWRGFEHIHHKGVLQALRHTKEGRLCYTNPISFELQAYENSAMYSSLLEISSEPNGNRIFISQEILECKGNWKYSQNSHGEEFNHQKSPPEKTPGQFINGGSLLGKHTGFYLEWQFVSLVPERMGDPTPQRRAVRDIVLAKDGSNIAEYLLSIRTLDASAFEGIIETLKYVLPYAVELEPMLTSELERAVYLQLAEGRFKVPGWLLSTGTLRIVSLLALLRHPSPPPLIVIEEIENGLDPRTIHLIVEEIRNAVESGKTQVIATTHSPYLLDLLHLSQIVVVERKDGEPKFWRPTDDASLREWAKKYGPGKLYTMDLLHQKEKPKP